MDPELINITGADLNWNYLELAMGDLVDLLFLGEF